MKKFRSAVLFSIIFSLIVTVPQGKQTKEWGMFSPYLALEKYLIASELNYEDMFSTQVTLEQWNMLAAGVQYRNSGLFVTASFAGLWHDKKSQFLPVLDANLGFEIGRFSIYGGKSFSLIKDNYREYEEQSIELTNPIYFGGKYYRQINHLGLELGARITRGKLNEFEKENFYSYGLHSKLSWGLQTWLEPYVSLSVEKFSFDDNPAVYVGIGVNFGKAGASPGIIPRVKMGPIMRVFKPNIYLYPQTEARIKVKVTPNGKITESIPSYGNGWDVKVSPDGTINGNLDFLFYEADVYLNSPEKGWCIPYTNLAPFFRNTLTEYGFNEGEIKDFIDYWTKKLTQSSYYAVYPVTGKSLDKICPLEIKPKPDKILRLWFVFTPLAEEKLLDKPEIEHFSRSGFTAVEWGGIIKE